MTVYLHKYSGTLPAGDIFNFGWHSDTGISLAGSHAAGDAWGSEFFTSTGAFLSICNPGVVWTKHTTYQLNALSPFRVTAVAATDFLDPGSNSLSNSLPQDMAEVVTLRTADPARKGRGRMYLPPVTVDQVTAAGELTTLSVTTILNALAVAWTASRSLGDNPVIFSRTTGLTEAILKYGVGTVLDRQSRRVNKVNTVRTFSAMP